MSQITDNMFLAIDILVDKKIESLKFNRTERAEIIAVVDKDNGEYLVDTGSVQYTAYSKDTRYRKGDYVLINIPNNDYSGSKTILDYVYDDNGEQKVNLNYLKPINKMIAVTDNLVNFNGELGLTANQILDENNKECYLKEILFNNSFSTQYGYTRLGLSADFKTMLNGQDVISGNYGLKLVIKSILNGQNYYTEYNFYNNEFFGESFEFTGYMNLSALLDISELGPIIGLSLYFVLGRGQNFLGTFKNRNGNLISSVYENNKPLPNNLFVRNINVLLGYSTDILENDLGVMLITEDSLSYNSNNLSKTLKLKWFSKKDDDSVINNHNIYYENDDDTSLNKLKMPSNYLIKWYQYDVLSPAADTYCGYGWKNINTLQSMPYSFFWNEDEGVYNYNVNDETLTVDNTLNINNFECSVELDKNKQNLRFKVIIFVEGTPITSNILLFDNTQEAIDTATLNAAIGLGYRFNDGTNGHYYFYGPDGYILSLANALVERSLELTFNGEVLTEATKIEWKISNEQKFSTIRDLKYYLYGVDSDSEDENINQTTVESARKFIYKINNYLNLALAANTYINCEIIYNGITYDLSIPFYFGRDSGLEYNLDLGLYYINGDSLTPVLSVNIDGPRAYSVNIYPNYCIRPILYDALGQEKKEIVLEIVDTKEEWSFNKQYFSCGQSFILDNNTYYYLNLEESLNSVPEINTSYFTVKYEYSKELEDSEIEESESEESSSGYSVFKRFGIPISKTYYFNNEYKNFYLDGLTRILYNAAGDPPISRLPYLLRVEGLNEEFNNIKISNNIKENEEYKTLPYTYTTAVNNSVFLSLCSFFMDTWLTIPCMIVRLTEDENSTILWSQPIFLEMETYSSKILNEWDGNLSIDEANNVVLSKIIGAGYKKNNKFSGVFMGNVSDKADNSLSKVGLYGYHEDEQVFAFRDNGTAFIGGSGKGRINFDGNEGIIESGNFDKDTWKGLQINLTEGTIKSDNLNLNDKFIMTKDGKLYIDESAIIVGSKELTPLKDLSNISNKMLVKEDGLHITNGETGDNKIETVYSKDSISFKQNNNFLSRWEKDRFILGKYLLILVEYDDDNNPTGVTFMKAPNVINE